MMTGLDHLALTVAFPDHRLKAADIATLVDVPAEASASALECFTLDGDSCQALNFSVAQGGPLARSGMARTRLFDSQGATPRA